jgi:16S rRNA (guanine527-N7)-methyltransferase
LIDFKRELNLEGIELHDNFNNEIYIYLELLKKWNNVHNISRMSDKELEESIIDSLIPLKFLEFNSLLDIGSGSGFPAIPIAIARKNIRIAMTEPIKKKSSFLNYAKVLLNLNYTEIYSSRIENLTIGKFDLVSSRAVAESSIILNLALPHLQQDGKIILYKGSRVENEIKNISDEYLNNNFSYEIISRAFRNYLIIKNKNI